MNKENINCFVIMPFDPSFDDVYTVIKSSVESALLNVSVKCFRLDETKPAGRITKRLLSELQIATICVADLSGCRPNVMWEVGYAMALQKPTIIITQKLSDLPFDLRDMQSLEYDRHHLSTSLGQPLKGMISDSLEYHVQAQLSHEEECPERQEATVLSALQSQVGELKDMIGQLVKAWGPGPKQANLSVQDTEGDMARIEGAWIDGIQGRSHFYAKMVSGELLVPYCYGGDYGLSAVYFGWRKAGDYWFARFKWVEHKITGFAFLKEESGDVLTGMWWISDGTMDQLTAPPDKSGEPTKWVRVKGKDFPPWAEHFFMESVRCGQLYV